MKYLVDADVLSEATKPEPSARVIDWLRRHDADLVVNPIIIGELQYGILLLPPSKKRTKLLAWFQRGIQKLNIVDIDAATAAVWAKLLADLKRKGRAMPVKDSLIAANARQHGFAIATGNTTDFRYCGVTVMNPFKD